MACLAPAVGASVRVAPAGCSALSRGRGRVVQGKGTSAVVPRACAGLQQRATFAGATGVLAIRSHAAHARARGVKVAAARTGVVQVTASTDEAVANISRKVARTASACKTLGRWGFWGQLILTVIAAVIVVFSFLFKGLTKATDAGLYFILFGICAGFFTTFWSLGIVRLGERLRKSATQLNLVPPRTEVVRTLSTGLAVNFVGLGATIVGLQATTGLLFAKTLTVAAQSPFTPGVGNPVLALDIFLVQAASNVMLAHWIGAAMSLWLLRTVNLPTPSTQSEMAEE